MEAITETKQVTEQKKLVCPKCRTRELKVKPSLHKLCVEVYARKFIEAEPAQEMAIDVLEYDEHMDAANTSEISRAQYFLTWRHMLQCLGPFKFDELTLRNLLEFRNYCTGKFAYYTAYTRVAQLMAYLRWRYHGELPKELKTFKMKRPVSDRVNEKNVLTVQEVMRMVNSTTMPRDKALTYCLWESARRIEEFLRLKARDLKFVTTQKGEYAYYETYADKGKGVKKDVRANFVISYPALLEWLKVHPSIDLNLMMRNDPQAEQLKNIKTETHDPDAPIWCRFRYRYWGKPENISKGTPIDADDCWMILHRAKQRASITKPVSAHRMRHSRITWMKKNDYSDDEIRIVCGYSRFSPMPTYYAHIGQEDVNRRQLSMHGLVVTGQNSEVVPIKHCRKCSAPNEQTSDFCMRCGDPMNERAKGETLELLEKPNKMIEELMKDPEFKELMVKKLAFFESREAKTP